MILLSRNFFYFILLGIFFISQVNATLNYEEKIMEFSDKVSPQNSGDFYIGEIDRKILEDDYQRWELAKKNIEKYDNIGSIAKIVGRVLMIGSSLSSFLGVSLEEASAESSTWMLFTLFAGSSAILGAGFSFLGDKFEAKQYKEKVERLRLEDQIQLRERQQQIRRSQDQDQD